MNKLLWVLQGFLALFFAFASGAPKLVLPYEMLPMPIPLDPNFVHAIGTCEVLGALGLILPWATGRARWLTPLAAACLTLLTICAATYQMLAGQPANAAFALVMGALAAFVAYGRYQGSSGVASARRTMVSTSS
jgi:DoxX-like protein